MHLRNICWNYVIAIIFTRMLSKIHLNGLTQANLVLVLLAKNMKILIFDRKMYAYYVEVPRILIFWSNVQFIPLVEYLEIFHFFYFHFPHTLTNL